MQDGGQWDYDPRIDPIDRVNDLLKGNPVAELADEEIKESLEQELNTLMDRLAHVKKMSNRFSGIELSPHVRGLARDRDIDLPGCANGPDAPEA